MADTLIPTEATPTGTPTGPTPLDESLKKFLAGPKKTIDAGVSYDTTVPVADIPSTVSTYRPEISDVINLSQDTGLGYTQAELWANEQAVAEQALAEQKNAEQLALQQGQFDIDKQTADWEAMTRAVDWTDAQKSKLTADMAAAAAANNATFGKGSWAKQPGFTQLPTNWTPTGAWR